MDVDNEKIAVAVLDGGEGSPRIQRIVKNAPKPVEKFFKKLVEEYDLVNACYEASFCGYELYRRLTDVGVACRVIAPSSVPKKSGDRVKTDRRDAVKLAMALRNGDLSPIYIPTKADESVRDYVRMYEDAKDDLKRAKQRVRHFLLRRDIRYEAGKSSWTQKYYRWLGSLSFDLPFDQETFTEYYEEVKRLDEKRVRIKQRVEQIAQEDQYVEKVKRLCAFKGIATLIALTIVVEIGDFKRFASAKQFMAFLGLVPSEHSSGGKRRVGSITKAGNSHLRKLLLEAAWHARSYHAHSTCLKRAREGLPADVVNYADRAGRRLTKKFNRLRYANRPAQVAATAAARELAGFIWGMMVGEIA